VHVEIPWTVGLSTALCHIIKILSESEENGYQNQSVLCLLPDLGTGAVIQPFQRGT
jgi:hypothetical protein